MRLLPGQQVTTLPRLNLARHPNHPELETEIEPEYVVVVNSSSSSSIAVIVVMAIEFARTHMYPITVSRMPDLELLGNIAGKMRCVYMATLL